MYGNELSGSIKCGEFLDSLQNQLASQEGLCCMEYVADSVYWKGNIVWAVMVLYSANLTVTIMKWKVQLKLQSAI